METTNQLETIIKESQLEPTKAEYILKQFQGYFQMASEWDKKSKSIVVTSADQKDIMQVAREGRLLLRDKRTDVEKARKKLKEGALREGQVIDGIAKTLKALISPIEGYLDKQEHFVEIREEAKREAKRQEIERRMEEEEAARIKAEAEKQEKIRQENIKLKKEAEERDRKDVIEKKKRDTRLANERAKVAEEREIIGKKLRMERAKAEDKTRKERERVNKEKQEAQDKITKEKNVAWAREQAERKEKEHLEELLKNQIECPKCHFKFNRGEKK